MSTSFTFVGENAAADLVGKSLPKGWLIVEKLDRRPGDTGGNFSINYWAEHPDGRRGFCKVLNFHWLLSAMGEGMDPVEALATATRTYQFERDLARECASLSRVVTAIDDGSFRLPGYVQPLVSFIIFEVADRDIRRILDATEPLDVAARLRCLHNIATGLQQLHSRGIAHQDVKPSNSLVFAPDEHGARITKVGDLGRATAVGRPMDHDEYLIAGDPAYAPPEALYGETPVEFSPRRYGCDLYQLGSMVNFVFTGVPFNALLAMELHPQHRWGIWIGSYDEVLPYVRDAFGRSVERVRDSTPPAIASQVISLLEQLCEPDPLRRGHTRTVAGRSNPYGLERIVTELDLLSARAQIAARRAA